MGDNATWARISQTSPDGQSKEQGLVATAGGGGPLPLGLGPLQLDHILGAELLVRAHARRSPGSRPARINWAPWRPRRAARFGARLSGIRPAPRSLGRAGCGRQARQVERPRAGRRRARDKGAAVYETFPQRGRAGGGASAKLDGVARKMRTSLVEIERKFLSATWRRPPTPNVNVHAEAGDFEIVFGPRRPRCACR